MNYIRIFVALGLIGWAVVNLAGMVMAIRSGGSAGHIITHAVLTPLCAAAAWLVFPRKPRPTGPAVIEPDRRVDVLEDEVTDLQRQLSDTQKKLDFTEQLLTQRPQSQPHKEEP
jgi:hypothetical protein